jgi:excisionase family DNA binding protein
MTADIIASTVRLPLASRQTRIPERTLRNWVDAGQLPAWRVGGRLHVRLEDIDKLAQPVEPQPRPQLRPAPPPRQPAGKLLSATEAMQRLKVGRCTVCEWCRTGRLRAQLVSGRWAIEETSVAALERLQ